MHRRWYLKNKKKKLEQNNRYFKDNPDKLKKYRRTANKKHQKIKSVMRYIKYHEDEEFRVRLLKHNDKYRKNNKVKILKKQKEYYQKNKEEIRLKQNIKYTIYGR